MSYETQPITGHRWCHYWLIFNMFFCNYVWSTLIVKHHICLLSSLLSLSHGCDYNKLKVTHILFLSDCRSCFSWKGPLCHRHNSVFQSLLYPSHYLSAFSPFFAWEPFIWFSTRSARHDVVKNIFACCDQGRIHYRCVIWFINIIL